MSPIRLFPLLALLVVALAGCGRLAQTNDALLETSATETTSDVYWFADGTPVSDAWGTLRSNRNGATMVLHTNSLPGGHAFTVWWVVFNHPENCSAACGEDDIFVGGDPANGPDWTQIDSAGVSVVFGTGHVVGDDGVASFGSHLRAGDVSGHREVVIAPDFGQGPAGLLEPTTAEVHAVIRSHGAPLAGHVHEQIGSFGGGCTPETGGDLPEGNACFDPQFAVFVQ